MIHGSTNKPLVSIIMNCFNGERYLSEAIKSVIAQTYDKWELIIWDNQSSDRTSEIAKSFSDERIHYFLANHYTTLGEARNQAIKKSKGEIIGFLDCDDIYLPIKLEKQVPLFNDPKVGIVICDTLFFNQKGIHKQLYKRYKPPEGMVFRELLSKYFVSLETAMIRRLALEALDYWFDPRFEVIEEYDLFVRLGYSWELAYFDEILAKWRVHSSSWTWTKSELFPREKSLMLESLSRSILNFYHDYSEEINNVQQSIAFEKALNIWENGNGSEARKIIKPKIKGNIKYKFFYFLTFFPFYFFKILQHLRGVIRPY